MAAIIKLRAKEIAFLRIEVEAKFYQLEPQFGELRKTSFKGSYAELEDCIIRTLANPQAAVSEGLLRKLFYDSTDKESKEIVPELSFNSGFLDACYLFISDKQFNRQQYLREEKESNSSKENLQQNKTPSPSKDSNKKRLVVYGGVFAGICFLIALSLFVSSEDEPVQKADILVSKYAGEKSDKGEIDKNDVKIGWYLKTEMDEYFKTALAKEVISSESEAEKAGKARGAKFVVWGEILGLSEEYITLLTRFQVLQKPPVSETRDSTLFARFDDYQKKTYPIGERGACEFQKRLSKELTCISLFGVGLGKYLEGEFQKASEFFNIALENCRLAQNEGPGDFLHHYYLGNCAYKMGQHNEALQHYFNSLHLNPTDHITLNNIGSVYAELGNLESDPNLLDTAAGYFSKAIKIASDFDLAKANLIQVNENLEDFKDSQSVAAQKDTVQNKPRMAKASAPTDKPGLDDPLKGLDIHNIIANRPIESPVKVKPVKEIREDLKQFLISFEPILEKYTGTAGKSKCSLKISYAQQQLDRNNFLGAISSVWSLFYIVGEKGARVESPVSELPCFEGWNENGLGAARKSLELLCLEAIRYYIRRGELYYNKGLYLESMGQFELAIELCTHFETTSSEEDLYDTGFENPNEADKLKSRAFLQMAYANLQENNKTLFCLYSEYAMHPGRTKGASNPSYFINYKYRNHNMVKVKSDAIDYAIRQCGG